MNQDQPQPELLNIGKPRMEYETPASAYYKARCEALEARIDDPAAVNAAAAVVLSAATIAEKTGQPFRQVFDGLMTHILKVRRAQRAERNVSKNGGFHPARKRK